MVCQAFQDPSQGVGSLWQRKGDGRKHPCQSIEGGCNRRHYTDKASSRSVHFQSARCTTDPYRRQTRGAIFAEHHFARPARTDRSYTYRPSEPASERIWTPDQERTSRPRSILRGAAALFCRRGRRLGAVTEIVKTI